MFQFMHLKLVVYILIGLIICEEYKVLLKQEIGRGVD